jgi:hypothetical protein
MIWCPKREVSIKLKCLRRVCLPYHTRKSYMILLIFCMYDTCNGIERALLFFLICCWHNIKYQKYYIVLICPFIVNIFIAPFIVNILVYIYVTFKFQQSFSQISFSFQQCNNALSLVYGVWKLEWPFLATILVVISFSYSLLFFI